MINTAKLLMLFLFILCSCEERQRTNAATPGKDTNQLALAKQREKKIATSHQRLGSTDTTITYEIDGLSAEGSELVAHYVKDTIKDVTWNIYGETGQSIIKYVFVKEGLVKATERDYVYEKSITEVNTDDDMKLRNQLQYTMDTTGGLITPVQNEDFVNVFNDMKAHVPFILFK